MTDWDALAQRIHDNAVDKGFWEADRDFGEMIALMHSELSEALEEHRDGRPAVWVWHATNQAPMAIALNHEANGFYADEKPEGIAVELADCVIRALDTLHSMVDAHATTRTVLPIGALIRDVGTPPHPEALAENFGRGLATIHSSLSKAWLSHVNKNPDAAAVFLCKTIAGCVALIDQLGVDVNAVIEAKMAYNATRPHKHGKRY